MVAAGTGLGLESGAEAALRAYWLGKCLGNLNLNQCKSFWPNRSQLFK